MSVENIFSAQGFLSSPLEAPNPQTGDYQELLRTGDGSRYIWTRIFYDRQNITPQRALVAVSIEGSNLMSVAVAYQGTQVTGESVGIGAVSDPDEVVRVGYKLYSPRTVYFLRAPFWSRQWSNEGSSSFRDREEFLNHAKHGFFPISVIDQRVNMSATAQAFLAQIESFLQYPTLFDPANTPQIQPGIVLA